MIPSRPDHRYVGIYRVNGPDAADAWRGAPATLSGSGLLTEGGAVLTHWDRVTDRITKDAVQRGPWIGVNDTLCLGVSPVPHGERNPFDLAHMQLRKKSRETREDSRGAPLEGKFAKAGVPGEVDLRGKPA